MSRKQGEQNFSEDRSAHHESCIVLNMYPDFAKLPTPFLFPNINKFQMI